MHYTIMKRIFLLAMMSVLSFAVKAQQMPEHILKLMYTGNIIENFYVDDSDNDKIADEGIKAMLKALDPHSTYTDPKETRSLLEQMEGSFGGIGIQFNIVSDTLYVIQTTNNGPSERAGILPGDRIVAVNDTAIAGVKMERSDIMTRLRGEKGTKVEIDVVRRGIDRKLHFSLVRDDISTETVDVAYMIDKKNAYIRITSFGAKTHGEFVQKLDSLKACGMKNLILDLSGNGGGYLTASVGILGELIDEAKLVVYTEGKKNPRYDYYSQGEGKFRKGNLVVIVDETSASASEILAGAVQDWDRGIIVGRRTFGKGLVQRPFQLPDGSMIRLTIARYYTPTGRSIQKPYIAGDGASYEEDLINRFKRNEFFSADSIHFADSLRFTTPKGKVVYGGGGIMPDIFVPLDTLNVTKYFSEVSGRNILYRYTIDYADNHRKALEKAKSINDLKRMLDGDNNLLTDFVNYAERQGVKANWKDIERSREIIEAQLRAYISRNSDLEDNAFYYFIRPIDKTVQRAIEELNKAEN